MSDQLASRDETSGDQKDHSKAETTEASSYTSTEEDERELEIVRKELAELEHRIGKLDRNVHLDGLREHFPLGTGGNRRSGSWQSRKRFDASFDKAKNLTPLYEKHLRLLAQEQAILTGKRAREREYEIRQQKEHQESAERVYQARIGDYVLDSAYGTVRVVRVNKQSLTIETETGRRETRKFSLIRSMAFTEKEIIEWFVKRDALGRLPIRAYVREVLAGNKLIEETVAWLKEETYIHYPLFIRNLPWQQIAQYFHDDERQQLATQVRQRACEGRWVTEENDQMYAWEQSVVDWLIRYRPHVVASSPLDELSIKTALSECDTLVLWGLKRS